MSNQPNVEHPVTLSAVRAFIARLVGEGVLEDDEDDPLPEEIDSLIERYGADALAEGSLRYE